MVKTYFIDEHHWVKFDVNRTPVTSEWPHGLRYSITLHEISGARIVGFDNAHPVSKVKGPAGKSKQKYDHKHRFRTIRPYDYSNAGMLIEDFWKEVDSVLPRKD
jgi:hypothetical protein